MNKDEIIDLVRDGYAISGLVLSDGEAGVEIFFPNERIPEIAQTLQFENADWSDILKEIDDRYIKIENPDGTIKSLVRKSQRSCDQKVTWEAYRRDKFVCQYCGADDRPMTIDHYYPQEKGGAYELDNLKAACRQCNKLKGNMLPEEWEKYRITKGLTYKTYD